MAGCPPLPAGGTAGTLLLFTVGSLLVAGGVAGLWYWLGAWGAWCAAPDKPRLSPPVQQLCDEFFQWRMQDLPEFATFVGIHDYNDRLDDLSLAAYEQRLATVNQFLAAVADLEAGGLTEHQDIVNVRVLRDELETFRDGYPYRNFYMALSNKEGIHRDLVRLLSWMPRDTVAHYNTLLIRLQQVPQQVQQILQLMTEGMRHVIVLHDRSMNQVVSQIAEFLVSDPEQSPLYQEFFLTFPPTITEEEAASLQDQARQIIAEEVTPAFQQLSDFVSTGYSTRPDIAVTSLPNGTDLYAQIIRFHTGSDLLPEDIQQMGYDEVARIEALMQEIVYELGYNLSVSEFSSLISSDPDNYYTTEEDLMEAFRHIVYNVTTPSVPQIFKNVPQAAIQVVADPTSTGAFYLTGSYDGTRPGVFYVGTAELGAQAKFEMLTLSLHEGNPGHHLQGSHAIESTNMATFRTVMDDRNYGHVPSRFPIRSYYLEGWGLYAESTGFDLELFGDPLERYGHYSDEIFRACRLVVDTGMHALGWTRDEAIEYLLQHTAMTRVDVENEVDRYITWPGQALSYKTGQLQISAFRADAELRLADQFDIKDFHDIILESVGPMGLVGEEVDEWVQGVLNP